MRMCSPGMMRPQRAGGPLNVDSRVHGIQASSPLLRPPPRRTRARRELAVTRTSTEVSPSPGRREAILDAATHLFSARGYADTGIDDIGAAVGITGPAVYRHFA